MTGSIEPLEAPRVSVKMLTYNHGPYIAWAIESVLSQQTDFPFELVIGEDCSTDGTREIVDAYACRYPDRIRVVTSESNVGMHVNSVRATRACRGRYIAWCEGDDYWQRTDKLQLQVDYLEAHPTCGLVCSDFDREEMETGMKIHRYARQLGRAGPRSPGFLDLLAGRTAIATCTVVARADLVKRLIDADPHLHQSGTFLMGDTQLWAEAAANGPIHYMDMSLATRRILKESVTQSAEVRKRLDFWISSAEMRLYLCDKYQVDLSYRCSVERDWRQRTLQRAYLDRDRERAKLVRQRSNRFGWRDWSWYLSVHVPLLRPLLTAGVRLTHWLKEDDSSVSHLVVTSR